MLPPRRRRAPRPRLGRSADPMCVPFITALSMPDRGENVAFVIAASYAVDSPCILNSRLTSHTMVNGKACCGDCISDATVSRKSGFRVAPITVRARSCVDRLRRSASCGQSPTGTGRSARSSPSIRCVLCSCSCFLSVITVAWQQGMSSSQAGSNAVQDSSVGASSVCDEVDCMCIWPVNTCCDQDAGRHSSRAICAGSASMLGFSPALQLLQE